MDQMIQVPLPLRETRENRPGSFMDRDSHPPCASKKGVSGRFARPGSSPMHGHWCTVKRTSPSPLAALASQAREGGFERGAHGIGSRAPGKRLRLDGLEGVEELVEAPGHRG